MKKQKSWKDYHRTIEITVEDMNKTPEQVWAEFFEAKRKFFESKRKNSKAGLNEGRALKGSV